MTDEKLIACIMDWLAGELSPEDRKEFADCLDARPDMDRHARELKTLWDKIEQVLPGSMDATPVLERVYRQITKHDQDTLTDEDLDQAAGGTFRPHLPQSCTKDPDSEG